MKNTKKITKMVVVGATLGVTGLLGMWVYNLVKKFQTNVISLDKIKFKSITPQGVLDLNLYLKYVNNTSLSAKIVSQSYKIYVNEKYVGELVNSYTNDIKPKATSIIGVEVNIPLKRAFNTVKGMDLTSLASTALQFIKTGKDNARITIDIQMKVRILGFIPVKIPYVYKSTLKNMMS